MYVPEVHEQEVHGSYSDIEIPFQVYVDDYLPAINQIDAFNDCLHQNRESVIMKYHEMHMDKRLNQIRARCLSLELEQRIDLNILKSYINECSFLKAKEYIKPFMQAQFQKPFLSMNIMIHLSESLREEIIKLLLLLGDYSKVNQLCELYGFHHCLSQKLESYHTIAFQFKAISQAIYDDPDVRFVQNLICEFDGKQKYIFIEKAKLWVYAQLKKNISSIQLEEYKQYIIDFGNDGEIYKYIGDIYYYQDDLAQAHEYYQKAIEVSRNGVMLLDIFKKTGQVSSILFEREAE